MKNSLPLGERHENQKVMTIEARQVHLNHLILKPGRMSDIQLNPLKYD